MSVVKFLKKNNDNNSENYSANTIKLDKNFIFFSKFELTSILNLYSKQVSKGSWRDYALDNNIIPGVADLLDSTVPSEPPCRRVEMASAAPAEVLGMLPHKLPCSN